MSYIGVDISYANGNVNLATAKRHGLQFCIMRIGFGANEKSQDDIQFLNNYNQCKRLGIPCGGYFYTYAMNMSDVESEKEHIKRLLSGKKFELPCAVDLEDADNYKARHGGIPSKQMNTNIAKSLCSFIESLGFKAGYYCNSNWCNEYIDQNQLTKYAFWYARPGASSPDRNCSIWQNQFGELGGYFAGIGSCDTDIAYTTFGATEQPKPQIHYAPKNARFTSDTTTTVYVKQGSQYTVKINCSSGRPKLVAGNGGVAEINFKAQSGTSYYFDVKAIGKVGQATGIYINDSKISTFIIKVDTTVESDTTMNIHKKVGQCYTIGLKCPDKPTVTLGSSGIATICGVYKSGDKWLCPIVGFNEGVTGVYTSVNREPSIKRFELKISK